MTASTSDRRRVVITGLGAVTDIGNDVESFGKDSLRVDQALVRSPIRAG